MTRPAIPFVVSWNITKMCNLKCSHCYLDADYLDGRRKDELTTEEGFRLIDEIHSLNPNAVLILTGGEPLLRQDLYDLIEYSAKKGLMPVLGTNGVLVTDRIMKRLIDYGIAGMGVSIDSLVPEIHDKFRGLSGALAKTINAIEIFRNNNMEFQIQTTVTRANYDEIPEIIKFAAEAGCKVFNLFFLVCTGRGQTLTDITPEQYETLLQNVVALQDEYEGRMMIKAKCAPHYKRVAYQHNKQSVILKGYTSDCLAGVNYCRVTPEGEITACPYMPVSIGNVKSEGFATSWESGKLFLDLREKKFKSKCGICEFRVICGGCRARAYATQGDYMLDDPWCTYEPEGGDIALISIEEKEKYWVEIETTMPWDEDALERVKKIPSFVQSMVVKEIEKIAKSEDSNKVTLAFLEKAKQQMKGMRNLSSSMKMPPGMGQS